MNIEYELWTFPSDTHGYNVVAYAEGSISVFVGGVVFLSASDVLLVELAVALYRWLEEVHRTSTDFFYSSMNYEDEPILAFRYDKTHDAYQLISVWSSMGVDLVPSGDVSGAVAAFLSQLRNELASKYNVCLDATIERALADV
jgi:hypothetical protein